MYRHLSGLVPKDNDYATRTHTLECFERVRDDHLYDVLQHPFFEEDTPQGEYIKLIERRPSVRSNLCRVVVEDSVALLFSEGHYPAVDTEDTELAEKLERLSKCARLNEVMIGAAYEGSVGSVCLWVRVLSGNLDVCALPTKFLTPKFDEKNPRILSKVTQNVKFKGKELLDAGWTVDFESKALDKAKTYWLMRVWDKTAEIWYLPWETTYLPSSRSSGNSDGVRSLMGDYPLVTDPKKHQIVDKVRTKTHSLGFVPMVWVRNLSSNDEIDGRCTFEAGIDTQIEMDYLMSQGSRGLKYNCDPIIVVKDKGDMSTLKKGGNVLKLDKDSEANLLTNDGKAGEAVLAYVRGLREMALEAMHGNRSVSEKLAAPQSGRGMEMMNQPLVMLADQLRISYGEYGLLAVYKMIIKISKSVDIEIDGEKIDLTDDPKLSLRWPKWFPLGGQDLYYDAQAKDVAIKGGFLSVRTAVEQNAEQYDVASVNDELSEIQNDRENMLEEEKQLASFGAPSGQANKTNTNNKTAKDSRN